MPTLVTFADLTHTAVTIDANNNPLAVGYIAAYARQHLGRDITHACSSIRRRSLASWPATSRRSPASPTTCGTSSCRARSRRAIKRAAPRTVVVMGGPNYPVDADEQQRYLEAHPEIDFFADGEGEIAFVNLFEALSDVGFDAARLRCSGTPVPGMHYMRRTFRSRRHPAANPGSRRHAALALHDGPAGRVLRRPADPDDADVSRMSRTPARSATTASPT